MNSERNPASHNDDPAGFARRMKIAQTIVELLGERRDAGDRDAFWQDTVTQRHIELHRRIDPRPSERSRYQYALASYLDEGGEPAREAEEVIILREDGFVLRALGGKIQSDLRLLQFDEMQARLRQRVDELLGTAPIPEVDSLPTENDNE